MLAFKLLLTPALLGLVSLAGRRWGPAVSGWLVGLPLTSGPVALFLALDLGTTFATRAAQDTMLGIVSVAGFCLAYSWLSMRVGWPGSVLAGWSVFFALTAILERFSAPLVLSFVGVISCLILALYLLPGSQSPTSHDESPSMGDTAAYVRGDCFRSGSDSNCRFLRSTIERFAHALPGICQYPGRLYAPFPGCGCRSQATSRCAHRLIHLRRLFSSRRRIDRGLGYCARLYPGNTGCPGDAWRVTLAAEKVQNKKGLKSASSRHKRTSNVGKRLRFSLPLYMFVATREPFDC